MKSEDRLRLATSLVWETQVDVDDWALQKCLLHRGWMVLPDHENIDTTTILARRRHTEARRSLPDRLIRGKCNRNGRSATLILNWGMCATMIANQWSRHWVPSRCCGENNGLAGICFIWLVCSVSFSDEKGSYVSTRQRTHLISVEAIVYSSNRIRCPTELRYRLSKSFWLP